MTHSPRPQYFRDPMQDFLFSDNVRKRKFQRQDSSSVQAHQSHTPQKRHKHKQHQSRSYEEKRFLSNRTQDYLIKLFLRKGLPIYVAFIAICITVFMEHIHELNYIKCFSDHPLYFKLTKNILRTECCYPINYQFQNFQSDKLSKSSSIITRQLADFDTLSDTDLENQILLIFYDTTVAQNSVSIYDEILYLENYLVTNLLKFGTSSKNWVKISVAKLANLKQDLEFCPNKLIQVEEGNNLKNLPKNLTEFLTHDESVSSSQILVNFGYSELDFPNFEEYEKFKNLLHYHRLEINEGNLQPIPQVERLIRSEIYRLQGEFYWTAGHFKNVKILTFLD